MIINNHLSVNDINSNSLNTEIDSGLRYVLNENKPAHSIYLF